ncbi:MAG: acetyl-CoA acetyltransferase [Chloroflexi bacterium]|jgi:acetyl-CoA C-acetyltransferase|nr:acetyl-CoA acetyltransferase [Chloroflexota bacterium]MBT7080545.1 acetyl-CoA acetyltransferase [Chloroflexota bacterium]MBT7289649.1 acetyl-CoA acetyltransferase [Chloroflexota bacterium]
MEKDVAIVGVGQSTFVRSCGMTTRELCYEGFAEAMQGINLKPSEIEASIICSAPEYDKQRSPAGVVAEYLGLIPQPTFYVESVCSSSSTGLRVAYSMVKAGLYKSIAVVGFQKMSELSSREAMERMGRGADVVWESPFGLTMPAGYATYATAHMNAFGTEEKHMAMVRAKNSSYGMLNEKAVYRKKLSVEDVLNSEMITYPLKKFDCCANADGSSCIIVASKEVADKITPKPVWIMGVGAANDTTSMSGREVLTGLKAAKDAANAAYKMAGVGPEDIDVAEVHDCFTISEILAYEDLGFAKPGEGIKLLEDKETYLGGKIPVNVDGGLLSKGHPIGATGGSQVRTIFRQLRGEAGDIQVDGAKVGLVHNIGGTGIYGNVTILGV